MAETLIDIVARMKAPAQSARVPQAGQPGSMRGTDGAGFSSDERRGRIPHTVGIQPAGKSRQRESIELVVARCMESGRKYGPYHAQIAKPRGPETAYKAMEPMACAMSARVPMRFQQARRDPGRANPGRGTNRARKTRRPWKPKPRKSAIAKR